MGWRFVKQPNGRLGLFSDIVDDFTYYDLTPEEAYEVAIEKGCGKHDAAKKVENGVKDEKPWMIGVYGDGTARWKDAMEAIERVHGRDVREARERGDFSDSDEDGE